MCLQVDCAKAHKGLFCGLFLLVVCIISLILFFVLIKKPNYRHIGVLQAHIVELIIYVISAIACIIAAFQVNNAFCHPTIIVCITFKREKNPSFTHLFNRLSN